MGKYLPASAGAARNVGLILGSGRSFGKGNGNPLQYFLPGESHEQRGLADYLQSMGSQRVAHDWMTWAHYIDSISEIRDVPGKNK